MDKYRFAERFEEKIETACGILVSEATPQDCYNALAELVKDQITRYWVRTTRRYRDEQVKQVYYFSLEFMLGKMLEKNLIFLGLEDVAKEALADYQIDIEDVYRIETDPGLGNGGLGRLAACFMDSFANLDLAGQGCGIRYQYGLFEQKIINGYQAELPDNWLRNENIWEIKKPNKSAIVKFYGNIHEVDDPQTGRQHFIHENYEAVMAIPYDIPIAGSHEGRGVNSLRLWSAESVKQFDFGQFSSGNYMGAAADRYSAEAISEVLYPDDSNYQNRLLRLKQQYFFVSAGLQSIIRHYKKHYGDLSKLSDYICVHINDTHPALAVPELMRILMDDEGFNWDDAWDITRRTISYTNHTIMPEALEKWNVDVYSTLLPRIYMITHEINERWCRELVERYGFDDKKVARMAIEAYHEVRMAYLAVVGSHSVNGVAAVHSELLKTELFKDFYELFPERFGNVTNGVTQRRWVMRSNPGLASTITDAIGGGWKTDMKLLTKLDTDGYLDDRYFIEGLYKIKRSAKERLAKIILDSNNVIVDPDAIFDVQVKRIHAYKRQLMNVMHLLSLYNKLRDEPEFDIYPRVFIFAGKAAPSYRLAKEIIKLINDTAQTINNDPLIRGRIKVVFLENYRVSLAERIFPASDVSEQISTASKEASGTGNMKFMMNGAVTIGTLDGANIEIFDAVGEANCIQFGLTVPEVLELYRNRTYNSREYYENDPRIHKVVNGLANQGGFREVYDSLITHGDEFFVLKDFASYVDAQRRLEASYRDRPTWQRMSAMNIAYSGRFSSDESICNYAKNIWGLHLQ
ncbi:MAG: glycogen/starch/alpha-glucan phosphorylase [Oscillospiraceae bacterium]|jgi:starch phosphorylase|nr:glycogen/starch/alpha-glucan phosphorylase [Oscillospiraceae bacterium]